MHRRRPYHQHRTVLVSSIPTNIGVCTVYASGSTLSVSLSRVDRSDRGLGGADPVRGYPRAALSIWPYGPRRTPSEAFHAADEKKAENEARAASSKPRATRGRRRRRKEKAKGTRPEKPKSHLDHLLRKWSTSRGPAITETRNTARVRREQKEQQKRQQQQQ